MIFECHALAGFEESEDPGLLLFKQSEERAIERENVCC
jgi:hypothetical protein